MVKASVKRHPGSLNCVLFLSLFWAILKCSFHIGNGWICVSKPSTYEIHWDFVVLVIL